MIVPNRDCTGLSWTPVLIHNTMSAGITPVQNMTRNPSVDSTFADHERH